MAFEHPLEADSVDHSSLFSTLVCNPVVGVVMWALGGHEKCEESRLDDDERDLSNSASDNVYKPPSLNMKRSSSTMSGLMSAGPSMVGSDLSGIGESGGALDSIRGSGSHQSLEPTLPRKQLSWSDHMGKKLAECSDKSNARHEPPGPEVPPVKAAMSRSRSVSAGMAKKSQSRFVPKGLSQRRETVGGSAGSVKSSDLADGNALESPQWGWYIRTTPPTPEMYYSSSSMQAKQRNISRPVPAILPNPIFQDIQKNNPKGAPMGWSSVPL